MSSNLSSKTIVNSDGYEVYVNDAETLPATSAGLLIAGSDGSSVRYISLDASGNQLLAGVGSSELPDGGVLSIQGVSSAFSLDISGQVDVGSILNPVEIVQATAGNLLASVGGLGAAGDATSGNPMRLGGSDGTNTHDILTDSAGRLAFAGAADDSTAVAGAPVRIGASDGSLTKDIISDTSGRLISVGAADAGSAVAGAPVLMGSSDSSEGNFMQTFITDSNGRLIRVGASGKSNAAIHNPLRLGGSDSSLTTDILTDTAGHLLIAGSNAAGSAPSASPVLSSGWDGTNVQIFKTDALGAIAVNEVKASDSALSSVNASTSSATLLAANAARQGGLIFNNSYYPCYLKLGASASTSNFSTRLGAYAYYELPASYTGEVSVVWNNMAATGSAMATELGASGGGGGGGGGPRPMIDANHIHVWNCDETAGATVLVDSIGGKNITLQGTAGSDYSLGQYVSGDAVPFLRCLNDGQNYVVASTSSMNFSASAATLECVVRMTALPEAPNDNRAVMFLYNGSQYLYISFVDNRPIASIYGRKAFGGQYTTGYGGNGSTSATEYLSGFDAQSNYTFTNFGTTTTTVDSTYHLMYVFDSSESEANRHKFYINGTLVARTQGIGKGDPMNGLTNFSLAGLSGTTRSSQCYIRDVRISNIARDATYAAAAYAALV